MSCFFSKDFSIKSYTVIENNFLKEFLPISEGDAVKVYIYGLYLCNNPKIESSIPDIAQSLNLEEKDVLSYFRYWEEFGILSILSENPLSVEYLPIQAGFSAKPRKYKTEKYSEFTKSVQDLLSERMISTNEYTEYFNIMETYSIKPEAMVLIVKYCVDLKGRDIGYKYISTVAKNFANRGIITIEGVEKELSSFVLKTAELEKVFSALKLKRKPDVEDQNLYTKWTEELSFEPSNIVFAAGKLKKCTMEKLDKFILDLYSKKCFSKEEISDYIDEQQSTYELAIKINKSLGIYQEVMEPVIDTYTNKWLSYGYNEEALLFISSYCFKNGKNKLKDMDELIESLRQKGYVTLSSLADRFEEEKKTDEFLSKLLTTAGVNRRPTPWDRENLLSWKSWNFSEDMILEAGKIASGKSSPIAYITGVLSNWKNKGIFSLENTEEPVSNTLSTEEYNRAYEKRRNLAVSTAQKNTEKALAVEGFRKIYERMFSIEKDLAFAEISNNKEASSSLEKEQSDLLKNAESLLKTIGLTLSDLTPKHVCEKCKDTGYVGTHRCNCLEK